MRTSRSLNRKGPTKKVNCHEIPSTIEAEGVIQPEDNTIKVNEYFSYKKVFQDNLFDLCPMEQTSNGIFIILQKLPKKEYREIVKQVKIIIEYVKLKYGIKNLN